MTALPVKRAYSGKSPWNTPSCRGFNLTRAEWRWAESNRRPNKVPDSFLHAYPAFDCRSAPAGRRASADLSSESLKTTRRSQPSASGLDDTPWSRHNRPKAGGIYVRNLLEISKRKNKSSCQLMARRLRFAGKPPTPGVLTSHRRCCQNRTSPV